MALSLSGDYTYLDKSPHFPLCILQYAIGQKCSHVCCESRPQADKLTLTCLSNRQTHADLSGCSDDRTAEAPTLQ